MFGLIRADDLHRWAGHYAAPADFPRLVRLLIRALVRAPRIVNFPADEAVRLAGYDGQLDLSSAVSGLPEGLSVWEMGTNREIQGKANEDYEKRTKDPKGVVQKNTSFVFVTPRQWPGKTHWAKERSAEHVWKQVLAFDAEDLVQWLEAAPAVALWFGRMSGQVPVGARALDGMLVDYRTATRPEFDQAGTLIGRADQQRTLLDMLSAEPQFVEIEAMTEQEGVAFVGACISTLPQDEQEATWARAIWLDDANSLRALASSCEGHLLVVGANVPSLPAETRLHSVIRVKEPGAGGQDSIALRDQPMAALIDFVEKQGVDRNDAYRRCYDADGSLERVRRGFMVAAPPPPSWSQSPTATAVAAAVLIGCWDEANAEDKSVVAAIAGVDYDHFAASIAAWTQGADPLVTRAGSEWRVHDRRGAWHRLEPFLMTRQVEAWTQASETVLLDADPRFELPPEERWLANIHGKRRSYSDCLREGLAEGLLIMAVKGDDRQSCYAGRRAQDWADRAVHSIFGRQSEGCFWRRVRNELTELAEISPELFLAALERDLAKKLPQVLELFEEEGEHGGCMHSNLLWALEALGWSSAYVGRVARILAALAAKDPGGRYSNRPANSLAAMLDPRQPQCAATAPERHALLASLAGTAPDVTADLCESLFSRNAGILHMAHKPSLRTWAPADRLRTVKMTEYWADVQAAAMQLLMLARQNPERWRSLLANLNQLVPEVRETVLAEAEARSKQLNFEAMLTLRTGLRKLLHHHNQFRENDKKVEWVYDQTTLDRLEALYHSLNPDDIVLRDAWLFEFHPERPTDTGSRWQEEQAKVETERLAAAEHLADLDFGELIARLSEFQNRRALGYSLGCSSRADSITDGLFRQYADTDTKEIQELIQGVAAAQYVQKGTAFLEKWMFPAGDGVLSERGCAALLVGLPSEGETWDAAERRGAGCVRSYWRDALIHLFDRPADGERAARALLAADRPLDAIDVLAQNVRADWLAADGDRGLVIEALRQGVEASNANPNFGQRASFDVTTLLKRLSKCGKVDEGELTQLEWAYFSLLKYQAQHELVIYRRLIAEPALLVEMLSLLYLPDGVTKESRGERSEVEKRMGSHAWTVLQDWRPFANVEPNAMPTVEVLIGYAEALMAVAAERGYLAVAKDQLGKALSSCPAGVDGTWPHETVRQVIEQFPSPELHEGFVVGRQNGRGGTSRSIGDGGNQERVLARQYRDWQRSLAITAPITSALLGQLAEHYERDANWMDVEDRRRR